ncbi:hypothetical protein P3X46_022583, partial [Hevea brasiliensis]
MPRDGGKGGEVYPRWIDNELCSLFIETLKAPYFNLMIGNTSNSFSDIIQAGERIEANLRMGHCESRERTLWYDATARCEYHGGAQGHSIDNCGALRGRVHALIRNGWLKIEGNGSLPNVTSNPLPNHNTGSGVNMIESEEEGSTLEVDKL